MNQAEAREHFDYNPKTGVIKWRSDRGKVKAGDVAGYVKKALNGSETKALMFEGKTIRTDRIAFIWMTGDCPKWIFHKDLDRMNDRWDNLEECESQPSYAAKREPKQREPANKVVIPFPLVPVPEYNRRIMWMGELI